MRSFPLTQQWWIQDFPKEEQKRQPQPIIWQIFGRKLHEHERIWTEGERP